MLSERCTKICLNVFAGLVTQICGPAAQHDVWSCCFHSAAAVLALAILHPSVAHCPKNETCCQNDMSTAICEKPHGHAPSHPTCMTSLRLCMPWRMRYAHLNIEKTTGSQSVVLLSPFQLE